MAKKRKLKQDHTLNLVSENQTSPTLETELGRGKVQDNALKAAVTSSLFRTRVEKAKKGKGSFQRKAKHAGRESYSIAA